MTVNFQLLFFDTFSHEITDVTQLDLVQFPKAVQVSEIRVIPLGARVKADFPGGVRLGATNPSTFEIEFFINDLSKRGAATFEKIGKLQYSQHGSIQLEFEKKPPTDGLLLRGSYNTITLAVYGTLTKVQREPSPPKPQPRSEIVPQPPPEKVNTHERIRDWLEDTKRKQHSYEISPSEEDHPEWEPKPPRSPIDFEREQQWVDNADTTRDYVRERGDSRERSRDKRGSYDRSQSREKSWERSERSSSRRDIKPETSRDKERDKERERDRLPLRDKERESRDREAEKDIDRDSEKEKKHHRGSRERFDDDLGPYVVSVTRRRHSLDEWDDRRSDRSDELSVRRPRTPTEPAEPPPDSPRPPSNLAFSEEGDDINRVQTLPPPILAGEMEAISDDEELLDLPPPENIGEEPFGEETLEEEDVIGEQAPAEEETEGFEYEEIMSDEDDLPEYQYEDYIVEEWEDWIKPFNPHDLMELPELLFFNNPASTEYERELQHSKSYEQRGGVNDDIVMQGNRLASIVSETPLPNPPVNKVLDGDLSQDVPEETGEIWVQAVEQVCQLFPQGLICVENSEEILHKLISWVECGLDFDMALNQQQPVFKIRHMKAGIRLTAVLLQCTSSVSSALLHRGIIDKLFILNDQPHLALSIRLLILKCIDAATDTPSGLQYFITGKTENGRTAYERVLELMTTVQQSRAKIALSVTIRKVHLLEVCEKLRADTFSLLDFVAQEDEEITNRKGRVKMVNQEEKIETEGADDRTLKDGSLQDNSITATDHPSWHCSVPHSLISSIISCLKQILRTFTYSNQLLVQPSRWLPGSKQFQLPKTHQNPFPFIYSVFEMTGLLESISVLLVTPALCQHPLFFGLVKSFLSNLMESDHGLQYLGWERKSTMLIIRALLQYGEESRDSSNPDVLPLYHVGVQLAFMMHVVHQLDCIAQVAGSAKRKKLEDNFVSPDFSQAVVHFNSLESLLMSPVGKESIVLVLGVPNFTEILFPYLIMEPGEDHETDPIKAACFGYAVDLLSLVVKFHSNVDFMEKHAEHITSLICANAEEKEGVQKSEEFNKLADLVPWLSIARSSEVFSYDKLNELCSTVQDNLEKLEKYPGELISALRILCHLTIPKAPVVDLDSEEHNNELIEELKYKYATMQLVSADLHTHLVNILSKLFSIYQQPFLYSSSFISSEGGFVVMLLKATLALLKNILDQIIHARNTDFKDLTAVIPLVQTYILLQAFPSSSSYFTMAHELQQEVISILLCYTQVVYTTEGEDVLSKSLWTQMMAEVFKYLMNAPNTMVCVITLTTELLPLPLPIQTHFPLSQEEIEQAVRVRKLWSAHLYSLAPTLHELIHRLGLATFPLLTHSLRRMCVALSDLSAPMALLVAKATLDLVLQTHRLDQRTLAKEESKGVGTAIKEDVKTATIAQASQQTARALNMLASLVSHAPTKAAVLHLLRGGSPTLSHTPAKTEEKYTSLLTTWCKLLSLPVKAVAHVSAQECLVTVAQYLLDHENAMQVHQPENSEMSGTHVSPQPSYSGVPHKDILLPVIESLVDVIRNSSSNTGIIQHSVKVLSRLIEHSYGFFYVKSVLDMKKGSLYTTFRLVSNNFSKDNQEFVCLLQDLLVFCHLLTSPFEERSTTVSVSELALYIGWRPDISGDPGSVVRASPSIALQEKSDSETKVKSEENKMEGDTGKEEGEICNKEDIKKEEEASLEKLHPLKVLEHLVVAEVGEEEAMESLYEEISHLISLLEREASYGVETCDYEEPSAVGLESLQELFASRIVWTFPTVDDDLHSLWFSSPPCEELEERDVVPVNLMDTCRKYADNFDLVGTLHKLVKGQSSHPTSPQKMTKVAPKYKPCATAIRPDRRGRPYVAPMRGRSFGRAMNIRSDPFRSRPPNTSRPPSLHVDDFVALESTGHQPTGPTGYNKISFGRGKMMLDSMRGTRGRVRVDPRGRFFHRPPFRGDMGRGMGRGIGMRRGTGWVFRGDGSPRGNFRGVPMNPIPPRFIRGRPFVRGMPGPKERFPQKFIDRGRRGEGGRHMRGFR